MDHPSSSLIKFLTGIVEFEIIRRNSFKSRMSLQSQKSQIIDEFLMIPEEKPLEENPKAVLNGRRTSRPLLLGKTRNTSLLPIFIIITSYNLWLKNKNCVSDLINGRTKRVATSGTDKSVRGKIRSNVRRHMETFNTEDYLIDPFIRWTFGIDDHRSF